MNDEQLRQLLKTADGLAGQPPDMPEDLAQRVRLRAQRRRRVRAGYSVAAAVVLAVGMTWVWARAPAAPATAQRPAVVLRPFDYRSAETIETEIEGLRREAELRLAVARRTQEILEELRRTDALKRQQPEPIPDPVAEVRQQADKAAYTLVSQADRMCRELDLCASAAQKLERVMQLFPDSPWAVVARQRLEDMKKGGDV